MRERRHLCQANDENAIAIGTNTRVSVNDGVAIGSGSNVSRVAGRYGGPRLTTSTAIGSTWYNWMKAKDSTENDDGTWTNSNDYSTGQWVSTRAAVSIGSDGIIALNGLLGVSRQLTGLAAGTYDTDAVNLAQWKNTMLATAGDAKEDDSNTRYDTATSTTPLNVTRLIDETLTLTGAGDNGTALTKAEMSTDANIGTIVGYNVITFRLAKDLTGLESVVTGNTTVDSNGLTLTNTGDSSKNIVIQEGNISLGGNTITNVGSGLGQTYDTTVSGQENWNNGASIGDVYTIVDKTADGIKVQGGKNITVDDNRTVSLNDDITLGSDASKQVEVDGNNGPIRVPAAI